MPERPVASGGGARAGPSPAAEDERRARRRGLVAGLTMAALLAGALGTIATRGDVSSAPPAEAEPVGVPTEGEATPPSVVIPLEPDPEALDGPAAPDERAPTPADAAAFAAAHRPAGGVDVQSVTVDLDGDGWSEVVVAAVVDEVAVLDVAAWDGEAYAVVFSDRGAEAAALSAFDVVDVTGDGVREILLGQSAPQRRSLALWEVAADGVQRQSARGGCWDGSHVYGSTGATVEDGVLLATCEAAGEQDVYRWDGQHWSYERTEAA